MSKAISLKACFGLVLGVVLVRGCGGGGSSNPPPPPQAAAAPAFWPPAGSYSPTQVVTLSEATPGATIHYTTDGSTPTASSAQYTAPISVAATTTIEAIAVATGYSPSALASAAYTIVPQAATGPAVAIVLTTNDQTRRTEPQTGVAFGTQAAADNTIFVDESQTYQEIEGFGAAFTDTACYLLNQVATSSARTSTMNDLFTRTGNGIGLSFMRNPMGGSDLARNLYSFDDLPAGQTDLNLSKFSIAHDQGDIIPLILQARHLNPQMKLMATPWSPPGWMKTSGAWIGGSLLPSMYSPFANYFVKYLQAYSAAGIDTDYVSLQNEPLFVPTDYAGMFMDAATQAIVLRDYVLPAFSANNITTKVLVYDHNYDRPDYPQTVFADPALLASPQIAGTAWHGYGGTAGVMTSAEAQFPGKANYQTETSGGLWVTNQMKNDFEDVTQVMRNFGKSYVKWSLAVDQNFGPHTGGCDKCSGIITVNSNTGAITYGVEYYTLGHFSRSVLPGAVRIYSSDASGLISAAFRNPDGSKVLVAFNDSHSMQSFAVQWGSQAFTYTLPALAGATITWSGTPSGSYAVPATSQIQASSYGSLSGLQTELTGDINGGYDLGHANNGAYAVYKNVDFGSGVSQVSARVACDPANGGNCGGGLEFHLDSATGPLIARITIPATGGWQTWSTVSAPVSSATSTHALYVVFAGSTAVGNLNWFQFN